MKLDQFRKFTGAYIKEYQISLINERYQIAENLVYGHFRKVAKDARLLDRLILASTELNSSAEDLMIRKESHELLNLAIKKSSPQRKRIYNLCKFEGKSYKEVSQEVGITTVAVNNQIILANKAIRQYFN